MQSIIIDAYQYSRDVTGTDRMAANFLRELQLLDHDNQYTIVCSREIYVRETIISDNFKIVTPPILCSIPLLNRYTNYLWRRTNKFHLLNKRADTYFSFHNMSLPNKRIAKQMIASNLDLIPITLDEYGLLGGGILEQKNRYKKVVTIADKIVSISEFSKNELCRKLEVPYDKVVVVPLAPDPTFTEDSVVKLSQLRTPPKSYFLTLGGSEPRKNVATVVKAFCLLPIDLQKRYPLFIVGGTWHGHSLGMFKKSKYITCLGYVTDAELKTLYQNSTAFIFASKYEGFGFTILEAMASGAPVISANNTSLAEVAGDSALLFDANDAMDLAGKMGLVLSDEKLRKGLVARGRRRARAFSWQASAKRLHETLTMH